MKLLKKQFIVLSLLLSILCCSIIPCFSVSAAPAVSTIAQLASYVATAIGLVNVGTNGSVGKASGSVYDSIKEWVSDNLGTGIYLDSNGDYIFSGTATSELFDSLFADSNTDVKVISNFSGTIPNNSFYFYSLLSPQMKSKVTDYTTSFDNVLMFLSVSGSSTDYSCKLTVFDFSNVAFLDCGSNTRYVKFINSSGNTANVDLYCSRQSFSGGSFGSLQNKHDTFNSAIGINSGSSLYECDLSYFLTQNDYTYANSSSSFFNYFPFYGQNGKTIFWSDKSIIVAKSVQDGLNSLDQNSGLFVTNYNINKVSENVINNSNWDQIYNSYVTNVSNSYNPDTMDIDQLRQIMKTYTDNIINAVNSGLDDIQDMVSYTNEWLSKIYSLLQDIRNKLDSLGGGGGSVNDYTDALTRIENYLSQIVDNTSSLENMAVYLSDLLDNSDTMITYLRQIANNTNGGGGGNGIPDVWKTLPDMPDQDILDTISDLELLQLALKNVVPFCFISVIGEFFAIFAVSPQAPYFEIPISLHNSLVNIDESIIIDLSFFDPIQPIIIVFWYAVFVVCLAYLTFKLFWFWTVFFYE